MIRTQGRVTQRCSTAGKAAALSSACPNFLSRGPPTEIIVPARDSWSRMVPPPLGMRAPGQEQAQPLVQAPALLLGLPRLPAAMLPRGPLPQPASFSSQPASSAAPPPAAGFEPQFLA